MSIRDEHVEMPIPFGIAADTGLPLEGLDPEDLKAFRRAGVAEAVPPEILAAKAQSGEAHFGTVGSVDPNNLSRAGWGVVFGPTVDQRIKDALQPLIAHRKGQVANDDLFTVFDFRPGESAQEWLARHGVRMDVVNPLLGVPFYLLIVAAPDEIPFEFQYSLDLYWGVGRLWFPTADEFRQYADSVVRYETMAAPPTARQTAIFATDHDKATRMFSDEVALPMTKRVGRVPALGTLQEFTLRPYVGDALAGGSATRDELRNIFQGSIPGGPPALLFSGSHGVPFSADDARQDASQGALLCQDWDGRTGAVDPAHYFAAVDLPANAKVHGLIHVMFACYGVGWPQHDNFKRRGQAPPRAIAARPMLARLPQVLLAHRDGGALAVLGHVERNWSHSFHSNSGPPQTQGFLDVLESIMLGRRLGQATDQFNMRWAALSTELAETLNEMEKGLAVADPQLSSQWVARDDARNYIVFGDPAVRLRVEDMPAQA